MTKWRCGSCKIWFWTSEQKPTKVKACVFYGYRGVPPFSEPYNDKPLIANINYCKECI